MSVEPAIAVVGATGIIGSEIITVLNERKFPCCETRLFASSDSAGEVYGVLGEEVEVEALEDASFEGIDIVFFALNSALVREWGPAALDAGARIIDVSGAYAMQPDAVLIAAYANAEDLKAGCKIAVSPSPGTVQLAPVLKVLQKSVGLTRVVVSSYEAVAGAGKEGLDELWSQTRAIYTQQEVVCEAFSHQIAFNCIPQVDVFLDNGETRAERRLADELRKVMGIDQLRVSATAVRVPVFHGLGQTVNAETERLIPVEELNSLLETAAGISLRHAVTDYPTMLEAVGAGEVHVGRIRRDASLPCGYNFWVVADGVRFGAALNAVRMAELMAEEM